MCVCVWCVQTWLCHSVHIEIRGQHCGGVFSLLSLYVGSGDPASWAFSQTLFCFLRQGLRYPGFPQTYCVAEIGLELLIFIPPSFKLTVLFDYLNYQIFLHMCLESDFKCNGFCGTSKIILMNLIQPWGKCSFYSNLLMRIFYLDFGDWMERLLYIV